MRSALTRRGVVRTLAGLATGVAISATPACGTSAQQSGEDDDAFLTRLIGAASAHIPYRAEPYRVSRSLRIPAGVTVTLEAKTRIEWHGPAGLMAALMGVFEAGGDDTGLIANGGEAYIACPSPMPFIYAAVMRGYSGFVVNGIQALECGHVYVGTSSTGYDNARLSGPSVNAARNVRIAGGGARYDALQTTGEGACLISFAEGCYITEAHYRNVPHGVQWWGGDSNPIPPSQGSSANERKCRNLLIENVSVQHCAAGGIWGSMGRDIIVRDCQVDDIGDVGFDAEGSDQVTFERCTGRNARNGCFTTFNLCNDVHIVDCIGMFE